MANQQPTIVAANGRRFAASAVAVLVFTVDRDERILLLRPPEGRKGSEGWQVVNGALEREETVLAGALREMREEVGAEIRVRPLGTVHAATFRYDERVQYMVDICYLFAHEGGAVVPGDDMAGSEYRWWSLDELADERVRLAVPRDQKWLLRRAVELYRLWQGQEVPLEPGIDLSGEPQH
jgi:ADP-ribose pyrophosphatase YjhB (NUDIX family)